MPTHAQSVQEQFDAQSQAYLKSAVHAEGPDIEYAEQLIGRNLGPEASGIDIGCGAGHLSFRLAQRLSKVVAVDPTRSMLATVESEAAARDLHNLETCRAEAHSLPFPDGSFDLVASRYSAHHWQQLERALEDLRRITKPRAALLLIDSLAPEDPLVDTHFQTIELLRDRSHVRNRSSSQWQRLLAAAGFEVLEQKTWPIRIEFHAWVERMRTPPEHIAAIRSLQRGAPVEVQQALSYESDGSFTLQTGLFWGRRCT